jgi:AcrR family transcriptional regulator
VRSWIPVPGTTTGRLVAAALELFGAGGFTAVSVGSIAEHAGVTTGSLYHHFGSKAGLYHLVRTDVEQRVLDRLEGAAAVRTVLSLSDLAPVLLVGFDYLVSSGFARLLGEDFPETDEGTRLPDEIERFVARALGADGVTVATLVAAAWRAALWHASDGPEAAPSAREAFTFLLAGG